MIKKTYNLKSIIHNYNRGMTHSMFTQCHSEYSRGMSYVELIVVLGIFSVLSSVVIFNYRNFQDRVDIKNLASDIALKVVEAQKSSLNGARNSFAPADWKPSYGVYFNSSTASDSDGIILNKKFIYFSDLDNDSSYDGLSSCTTTECLDKITITKNNYISRIDSYMGSIPTQINPLSVIFKRPDSSAIFVSPGLLPGFFNYIQITIASPRGETALIKLYPSGRVQIN